MRMSGFSVLKQWKKSWVVMKGGVLFYFAAPVNIITFSLPYTK